MTATSISNIEAAKSLIQAWREGGEAAVCAFLSEDVVFELPFAPTGIPRRIEGRAAMQQALAGFFALFRRLRLNAHECYECKARQTVILECTSIGLPRHEAPVYQNRYVFILAFRDGLIRSVREFSNPYPVRDLAATTSAI